SKTDLPPRSPIRSSPNTSSCARTSSLSSNESSPAAKGARPARNRIQTEVSTRTIMQRAASPAWPSAALCGGVRRPPPPPRPAPLGAAQRAQPLLSCVTHERFKAETDGVGVRARLARRLRFSEQKIVDVHRLLHTA